jgi:uncharacterized membrane protein
MNNIQNNNDMDQLKRQYGFIDEKLDDQRIVADEGITNSIRSMIRKLDKRHKSARLSIIMAIPLIIIINVNTHIFNWWFLAFFVLILLLDIFFEIQKEKIMDPKAFLDMDLLKAKEKILRYKRLLNKENLVKMSFLNVMAVCIILLVFNRASSPYVTVLTVVYIIVVFTYYIFKHKKTIKELDNLANQIKSLKQA